MTLSTYQVLTWRPDRDGGFPHLSLFQARSWGLIIYDKVLLPAPVFRVTADLQARRRLGLTATLVREDGREGDVFALIGPKRYDVPWRDLERRAWIATAVCTEVRVPMSEEGRMEYALSAHRAQFRVAAENPQIRLLPSGGRPGRSSVRAPRSCQWLPPRLFLRIQARIPERLFVQPCGCHSRTGRFA